MRTLSDIKKQLESYFDITINDGGDFRLWYDRFTNKTCIANNYLGGKYRAHYNGVPIEKFGFDVILYQELIWKNKPNVIIECGSFCGASALMLYHSMLNFDIEAPKVISIDNRDTVYPELKDKYDGLTYLTGDDVSDGIVGTIKGMIRKEDGVMCIVDSAHDANHIRRQFEIYGDMVTSGQYFIIEDSYYDFVPDFQMPGFVLDLEIERCGFTNCFNGFYKKL